LVFPLFFRLLFGGKNIEIVDGSLQTLVMKNLYIKTKGKGAKIPWSSYVPVP
jgi:hypothetical protein